MICHERPCLKFGVVPKLFLYKIQLNFSTEYISSLQRSTNLEIIKLYNLTYLPLFPQ